MCCRSCTSKLKVPHRFEKKGKDLSRVCHACLLGVLAKRVIEGETQPVVKTRVVKYVWGGREPATIAEKQKLLPRVFFPAHWENVYDTATCFICAVRTDRRHRQENIETCVGGSVYLRLFVMLHVVPDWCVCASVLFFVSSLPFFVPF